MSKKYKYFLTIVFNIALFYFLTHWLMNNIHWHDLWHDVGKVNWLSLLIVLCLDLIVSLFYASRLNQIVNISFWNAWKLVCIGNGLNNLMPFRLGDVARIYYGREYFQLNINQMIAATVLERYCDLILLLIMGLTFFIIGNSSYGGSISYLFLILLSCGIISLFVYRSILVTQGKVRRWLHHFPVVFSIVDNLVLICNGKRMKKILLFSSCIWLSTILIYYLFFSINLPQGRMNLSAATILCFTTTLGFAIPYMIAGIGVFESAIFYYLIHFMNVSPTEGVALALVFHSIFSLPQIFLMSGIFALRKIFFLRPFLKWRRTIT